MIHAADTAGLVVITQTQPIYVIFTITADDILCSCRTYA